jgi:hypothetical protein
MADHLSYLVKGTTLSGGATALAHSVSLPARERCRGSGKLEDRFCAVFFNTD